jgi:hypothetical protein
MSDQFIKRKKSRPQNHSQSKSHNDQLIELSSKELKQNLNTILSELKYLDHSLNKMKEYRKSLMENAKRLHDKNQFNYNDSQIIDDQIEKFISDCDYIHSKRNKIILPRMLISHYSNLMYSSKYSKAIERIEHKNLLEGIHLGPKIDEDSSEDVKESDELVVLAEENDSQEGSSENYYDGVIFILKKDLDEYMNSGKKTDCDSKRKKAGRD